MQNKYVYIHNKNVIWLKGPFLWPEDGGRAPELMGSCGLRSLTAAALFLPLSLLLLLPLFLPLSLSLLLPVPVLLLRSAFPRCGQLARHVVRGL